MRIGLLKFSIDTTMVAMDMYIVYAIKSESNGITKFKFKHSTTLFKTTLNIRLNRHEIKGNENLKQNQEVSF